MKLISIGLISAIAALPAYAQTNQSQARTTSGHSLLSTSQKESLKSLGIKIAIPRYVPQGFRVVAIKTEPCRAGERADANGVCRFRPSYAVLYRNAQNHCFAVDAIGGGVGGPSGRYTYETTTKLFGKVDVNIGVSRTGTSEPITSAIANTPQKLLWTFPAGNSPFYAVATLEGKANRISSTITCSTEAHLDLNEFAKIVRSLDWLP
jgi:hypothetical protein